MAIEKLNRAAKEAQPTVINMAQPSVVGGTLPRVEPARHLQLWFWTSVSVG
jgi:hypothetical protein